MKLTITIHEGSRPIMLLDLTRAVGGEVLAPYPPMDTVGQLCCQALLRAVEGEVTPFSIYGGSRPGMLLDLT